MSATLIPSLQERLEYWFEQGAEARRVTDVTEFHTCVGTSKGLVRSENQDRAIVLHASFAGLPHESISLFAICDGMGGMSAGSDCARTGLSNFVSSLISLQNGTLLQRARQAILEANDAIYEKYGGRGGTTFSGILFTEKYGGLAINVGDSRIYEFSKGKYLKQLSTDDTIEAALAKARNQSSLKLDHDIFAGRLAQYLGMGEDLQPHIFRIKRPFRDTGFLLTSDGAHQLAVDTLSAIILNAPGPAQAIGRLIYVAEWSGGNDNATAICIWPRDETSVRQNLSADTDRLMLWTPSVAADLVGEIRSEKTKQPKSAARDNQSTIETLIKTQLTPQKKSPAKTAKKRPTGKKTTRKKGSKKHDDDRSKTKVGESPKEDQPKLDIDFREPDDEKTTDTSS